MKCGIIVKKLFWSAAVLLMSMVCYASPAIAKAEKWPGVDESVVEKYAKEHGREAREPFINTDQGDLLLFVFLLAGTIGGFAAGYYWRILMVERAPKANTVSTRQQADVTAGAQALQEGPALSLREEN